MSLRIAGYAALFDLPDGARDTIRRGAFTRTLEERHDPYPLYWQHRSDRRIGWVDTAGEDARGLRIIARIDQQTPGGRELAEIDLFEVSVVTHPLQPQARIHLTA